MNKYSILIYMPSKAYWKIKHSSNEYKKYFNRYMLYIEEYDDCDARKPVKRYPLFTKDGVINANITFQSYSEFARDYLETKEHLKKTKYVYGTEAVKILDYCEQFESMLSPENKLYLEIIQ